MIASILAWIAGKILEWLLGLIEKEIRAHLEQVAKDKARGKIDEGNIKKYEEAKSRKDRVDAALDLLNGRP